MDLGIILSIFFAYIIISIIIVCFCYIERPYDSNNEKWTFGLFWIFYFLIWLFITAPKTIIRHAFDEIKK